MLASVDWSNLTVAGAFIVGVVVGAVAITRVFRSVMDYLRNKE